MHISISSILFKVRTVNSLVLGPPECVLLNEDNDHSCPHFSSGHSVCTRPEDYSLQGKKVILWEDEVNASLSQHHPFIQK